MVSLDSIATMHESPAAAGQERDAVLMGKLCVTTGPSVLSRRLNRKMTEETEGTSTTDETDEGSHHESEELSDEPLDFVPEAGDDFMPATSCPFDNMPATSCPFDYMPSVRTRPAFSEREVAETWPTEVQQNAAPAPAPRMPEGMPMQMPPMQPMAPQGMQPMAPQGMQPMAMQQMAMQQMGMQQMGMQAMQQMAMPAAPQSMGPMMVPVPVPVPMQMPFPMQNLAPTALPVPKGFKLVKIPEPTTEKKEAPAKSAISNPASTERKIFVGGLNPATTGQTLREYFSSFGPVTDAKVIRDGEKSKGFGFVQFKESIPAEVLEQAHIIDQRRCGVGPAFHREGAQEVVA
jgi:hypothetical protein